MRVGRGESSGKGKTSGRGHKGQMSRSGHKRKPGFEGGQMPLIRRIPKRGFTSPRRRELHPINVGALAGFTAGSVVGLAELRQAGLVQGKVEGIKILGDGELAVKLNVKANGFSATARQKIEAAGGTCEVAG
jgi:large subunit ribosomal protein L15